MTGYVQPNGESTHCASGHIRRIVEKPLDDKACKGLIYLVVGIDPKYDFVLIHLNVPSKMIMATPTSTAGQDTQGAEQSSYKVTCAEPDGARGTSDLVDRSTRRHQGQS